MTTDPFAPIGRQPATAKPSTAVWTIIVPVPAGAPAPPEKHYKLGAPSMRWRYADATGATLGYVCRFEATDPTDEKKYQPLVYAKRQDGNGKAEWRWKSWEDPRPLYGLAEIAKRPGAAVVVTEGEKAADAAGRLLPGMVAVTSPNGAKSAAKADWTPLRGRTVTIWPDRDMEGLAYALTVAKLASAAGAVAVAIVSPPSDVKVKWDAADALNEGWDQARAAELIASARPAHQFKIDGVDAAGLAGKPSVVSLDAKRGGTIKDDPGGDPDGKPGERKRGPPQRDVLIGLTEFCELWHDPSSETYVTFPVKGHRENWPIRSRSFRLWLTGQYYGETGSAVPSQALEEGIRVLEARALHEGPEYQPFLRTARHPNGTHYYDLGDTNWRAVEIGPHAWQVTDKVPVKFLRSRGMRALPEPEGGEGIDRLRRFVNVRDDADFKMLVSWLIAAMHPMGPCPILILGGEQGTAKSFIAKLLRSLVDPSAAPARRCPKDDRDLMVSAFNAWVLSFDNISFVAPWLSDALCSIATAAGYSTRMLHTDAEELIFDGHRPIILNGIGGLTDRPDLIERAVSLKLQVIPEDKRRSERAMLREFESSERPLILGALFDGLSAALRNYKPDDEGKGLPRMADFQQLVAAAESGLGWSSGSFTAAYRKNRGEAADDAFEDDPVCTAIRDMFSGARAKPLYWGDDDLWPPVRWEGTAGALLDLLCSLVPEKTSNAQSWPKDKQALGYRIDRIAAMLRANGYTVEKRRSAARLITLAPPPAAVE